MMHIINTFIFRDKSIEFKRTIDSISPLIYYLHTFTYTMELLILDATSTVFCIWAVITIIILIDKNIFLHIIIIEQHWCEMYVSNIKHIYYYIDSIETTVLLLFKIVFMKII